MIYTIKGENLTANINDLGAELISVKNNDGKEFIFQPSQIWIGQSKNLFPNVGAVKEEYSIIRGDRYPMYQHGFAKEMVFTADVISESKIEFSLHSSEYTKKFVPYNFTFKINFEIKDNQIEQVYEVINQDNDLMYFGVACHTGFAATAKSYVEHGKNDRLTEIIRKDMLYLNGEEVAYNKENGITKVDPQYYGEGARILNNFDEKVLTLVNPELSSKVKIEFYDFDYITLWSISETFMCMMPWCALPDCDDTNHIFEEKKGNHSLKSGEKFVAKQIFTFSNL